MPEPRVSARFRLPRLLELEPPGRLYLAKAAVRNALDGR
jgi:hypothetical protein